MFLNNKFYKIISVNQTGEGQGVVSLELLPDCKVYEGHFPGKPVCPGVCNMETIKECACKILNRDDLRYDSIKLCRLTAVATPAVCPKVNVEIKAELGNHGYLVWGQISDGSQIYMELKGVLV
jgi:3-hydroxyacyl-[acyl-carrier-protein] dehydratase